MDLLRHVVEVYGYDVFLCHNILSLSYLLLKDKKCGQIKKSTTLYWILLTLRTHFQSCHLLTHLHPSSEYLLLCRDTRGWRLSQLTLARARGRGTPWRCHHNVYHRADTIGQRTIHTCRYVTVSYSPDLHVFRLWEKTQKGFQLPAGFQLRISWLWVEGTNYWATLQPDIASLLA